MYQTIDQSDFIHAFDQMRPWQFSREALEALFDHLEEYEQDTGEPMELDVIALCCEWSEYGSPMEAAEQYGWEEPASDEDESAVNYEDRLREESLEYLVPRTTVLELSSGGVLIVDF